jgi:hypothetical protein
VNYLIDTSRLLTPAFLIILAFAVVGASAQTTEPSNSTVSGLEPPAAQKQAVITPAINDLAGVAIGMTGDQVKEKLGKPESGDDSTGMYYSMDNGESMQLAFDADKKVKMIAMMYSGKGTKAPEPTEVFGAQSSITAGSDGRIYKMVRYPSAGYWVAYSRLNLDAGPMITVTMQKMLLPK